MHALEVLDEVILMRNLTDVLEVMFATIQVRETVDTGLAFLRHAGRFIVFDELPTFALISQLGNGDISLKRYLKSCSCRSPLSLENGAVLESH